MIEAIPAIVSRYGPFGNVFFRPMEFERAGSFVQGHVHNYDHVTWISSGVVFVKAYEIDSNDQRLGPSFMQVFKAPAVICIKKRWMHEFTALEDNTLATCIFALRDRNGEVTDVWDEQWGMAATI